MMRYRKYSINEKIFDIIDTEEKAYWLGFLYGDGNVKENSIRLELSRCDKHHIEKFALFLQSNHPVKDTRKNCSRICVGSKKIVNSLSKYGVVSGKTYKRYVRPSIDNNLLRHFYRGIIDSDGWMCVHKLKKASDQHEIGISNYSPDILEEIRCFIIKELNISRRPFGTLSKRNPKPNQSHCAIIFGGNKTFIKLYEFFYKDAKIYLDRKYNLGNHLREKILNRQKIEKVIKISPGKI